MLFNSYEFLLAFLPITLVVHHLVVTRLGHRAAWLWLVTASLIFYGWWYAPYLLLLLGSMGANFLFGRLTGDPRTPERLRRTWLLLGVTGNLSLLAWFKYAGFLDRNLEALTGFSLGLPAWALPLAISFFTFQQIAYLVDAHRGLTKAHDALDYALFVTFFPQLVAGPIVHHGEMIPQFREGRTPDATDRAVGATMFVLGLAKKVLIADMLAPHVDRVFGGVAAGQTPTVLGAWSGLLAFWFQVYFDFSGYSDMAVGLARMFGIRLPVNFDAPYRANNMLEFWERWHVTLSRFLRDYLYIPLGGNRRGVARRYVNLFATMTLGGLWHGAAWTFVIWGALNGVYLLINHAWRATVGPMRGTLGVIVARTITTLAAMTGHVFFRAESVADAVAMLGAMSGLRASGFGVATSWLTWTLLGLLVWTQVAPTSHRWLERYEPVLTQWRDELRWPAALTWRPTAAWGVVIGLLALACIPVLERAQAFIYWAF